MRSHLSIFSFKRANPLAGLMLFVLAVLVIEAGLASLPQNSLINSLRAPHVPAKPPDWQIMGDSVAGWGILSEQLATGLAPETNVVNLALAGSGPEFSYFILKRELAAGIAPKAIIYAPSPHTFGTKRIGLLVGAYATWPEIAEIAAIGIEPFEVFYGVICKLSYSLKHREQLAELLKGRRIPQDFELPSSKKLVSTTTNHNDNPFPAENLHVMYRKGFETNTFNLHFFEAFLHLSKRQHIPIYWANMPVLPVVQQARVKYDFENTYQHFLKKYDHKGLITPVITYFPVYPSSDFKDYTHLNNAGAEKYTGLLIIEMNKKAPEKPNIEKD